MVPSGPSLDWAELGNAAENGFGYFSDFELKFESIGFGANAGHYSWALNGGN